MDASPPKASGEMVMTPVLLAQARALPKYLARLPDCTPPDSIERCVLVASLEKLLVQFGFDGGELYREQLTPEAAAKFDEVCARAIEEDDGEA